jgi:hypothetical protein
MLGLHGSKLSAKSNAGENGTTQYPDHVIFGLQYFSTASSAIHTFYTLTCLLFLLGTEHGLYASNPPCSPTIQILGLSPPPPLSQHKILGLSQPLSQPMPLAASTLVAVVPTPNLSSFSSLAVEKHSANSKSFFYYYYYHGDRQHTVLGNDTQRKMLCKLHRCRV